MQKPRKQNRISDSKNKMIRLAICCLILFPLSIFASNAPFLITSYQEEYDLSQHLSLLEAPADNYTFEQVRRDTLSFFTFSGKDAEGQIKLEANTTYWGKLTIQNRLSDFNLKDWNLYLGEKMDSVEVYLIYPRREVERKLAGFLYSYKHKDKKTALHINRVGISIEGGASVTVLFRVKNIRGYKPSFNVKLLKKEAYENRFENIFKRREGIFLGFMLTMIFFNLLMFSATKDKAFLWHGTYLSALILFLLDLHYISHNFYPFKLFPIYKNSWNLVLITLTGIGYLYFIRTYMDLKKLLPRWDLIFQGIIFFRVLLLLVLVIYFHLTYQEVHTDYAIAASFLVEYTIVILWFLWDLYKTKKQIGYFLIAGTLFILIDLYILTYWYVINVGSRFNLFLIYLGFFGEITLFTYGLGVRFFRLRKTQEEFARTKRINRMKDQFYTNITHEFRTPLTIIKGLANELKYWTGSPVKKVEYLKTIENSSDNILKLVNELLDLSKVDSGFESLNLVRGDIISFLGYLTTSYESFATQGDISLQMKTNLDTFEMDYDVEKIQTILSNLLSNAIKFTGPNGKVTVFAEAKKSGLGDEFIIRVKDTGVGIPEHMLPFIFDRFYQGYQHEYNSQPGTGIGLALVKGLVKLMKGTVEVESEVGKGTEFTVKIPVSRDAEPVPHPFSEAAIEQEHPITSTSSSGVSHIDGDAPTLLIVDDSPEIIDYMKSILDNHYQIEIALDGKRGLEKAIEVIPDMVISDVIMPVMEGYEMLEELKKDVRTSHIPVILLTAKDTEKGRLEGFRRGAIAYMPKPFNKEELLLRIENWFKEREKLQKFYQDLEVQQLGQEKEPDPQSEFLKEVYQNIREHIDDESFKVEQLARAMLMSRSQLYRKFKALTGENPKELITKIRMEEAKRLLEKGELAIAEVGQEVGYPDPSNFTKVFKDYFQIKPSEVQKLVTAFQQLAANGKYIPDLWKDLGYNDQKSFELSYKRWFGEDLQKNLLE